MAAVIPNASAVPPSIAYNLQRRPPALLETERSLEKFMGTREAVERIGRAVAVKDVAQLAKTDTVLYERFSRAIENERREAAKYDEKSSEHKEHMTNVVLYQKALRFYLQLNEALPKEDAEALRDVLREAGSAETAALFTPAEVRALAGKEKEIVRARKALGIVGDKMARLMAGGDEKAAKGLAAGELRQLEKRLAKLEGELGQLLARKPTTSAQLCVLLHLGKAFNTLNALNDKFDAIEVLASREYIADVGKEIAALRANGGNFAGVIGNVMAYNSGFREELARLSAAFAGNEFAKQVLELLDEGRGAAVGKKFGEIRDVAIPELGRIVHYANVVDMLKGGKGDAETTVDYYGRVIDPGRPDALLTWIGRTIREEWDSWTGAERISYGLLNGLEEAGQAYNILLADVAFALFAGGSGETNWRPNLIYSTWAECGRFERRLFSEVRSNRELQNELTDRSLAFLKYRSLDAIETGRMLVAANREIARNWGEKNALIKDVVANFSEPISSMSGERFEVVQGRKLAVAKDEKGKVVVFPGASREDFASLSENLKALYGVAGLGEGFSTKVVIELPAPDELRKGYARLQEGSLQSNALNNEMAAERLGSLRGAGGADVLSAVRQFGKVHVEFVPEIAALAYAKYEKAKGEPVEFGIGYTNVYVAVFAGEGALSPEVEQPALTSQPLEHVSPNCFAVSGKIESGGSVGIVSGPQVLFTKEVGDSSLYRHRLAALRIVTGAKDESRDIAPKIEIPQNVLFRNGAFVFPDGSKVAALPVYVRENGVRTTAPELTARLYRAKAVRDEPFAGGVLAPNIFSVDEAGRVSLSGDGALAIEAVRDEAHDRYLLRAPKRLRGEWVIGVATRHEGAVAGIEGVREEDVPTALAFTRVAQAGGKVFSVKNIGAQVSVSVTEQKELRIDPVLIGNFNGPAYVKYINPNPAGTSEIDLANAIAVLDGSIVDQQTGEVSGFRDTIDGVALSNAITPLRNSDGSINESSAWASQLKGFTLAEKAEHYDMMKAELEAAGASLTPNQAGGIIGSHVMANSEQGGSIAILEGAVTIVPGAHASYEYFESSKVLRVRVPFDIAGFGFGGVQSIRERTAVNGAVVEDESHLYPILDYYARLSDSIALELGYALGGKYSDVMLIDDYGNAIRFTHELDKNDLAADLVFYKDEGKHLRLRAHIGRYWGADAKYRSLVLSWQNDRGVFFGFEIGGN